MKQEFMPLIKLEVEGMKASIITALGLRGSELSERVNAMIDEAVKSHDFDKDVTEAAHACITESIHELFQFSGSGRCLIRKVISAEFDKIFKLPESTHEETTKPTDPS